MKKLIAMLLTLSLCVSASAPVFATSYETSSLTEFKQSYINDGCFYQVTDRDYLDSIDDDEIIDVFYNINVTKKLLNSSMILDIQKVTESDICRTGRLFDTEEKHMLSTAYDNVIVIKRATVQSGNEYSGATSYLTYAYLSNEGIADFIINDWANEINLGETLMNAVAEWIVGTIVGAIGFKYSVAFSIVVGAENLGGLRVEQEFRTALKNIYDNGDRAILTLTTSSRSCVKWSDRYFYTENASRAGLDIVSAYSTYSND